MTVNVLGTPYQICVRKLDEDESFSRLGVVGYCDHVLKRIVVCDLSTMKECEHETPEYWAESQKWTLRHEIVHAFFAESGLHDSACEVEGPYTMNEELVDWIAIQGPKLHKAWEEAGAL